MNPEPKPGRRNTDPQEISPNVAAQSMGRKWTEVYPEDPSLLQAMVANAVDIDPTLTDDRDRFIVDRLVGSVLAARGIDPNVDPTTLSSRLGDAYAVTSILVRATVAQAGLEDDAFNAREHAKKMVEISHTDPLTGLYNRRGQEAWLIGALENRKSSETPSNNGIVEVNFDLTNLKRFNDWLGESFGDEMIKRGGQAVDQIGRADDIKSRAGRHGGDELNILVDDITPEAALGLAKRLHEEQLAKDNTVAIALLSQLYANKIQSNKGAEDIKLEYEIKRDEETQADILFVEGRRICLVDDLVVLGVGTSGELIEDIKDMPTHRKKAENSIKARKKLLYEKNGGSYRTTETAKRSLRQKVGALASRSLRRRS